MLGLVLILGVLAGSTSIIFIKLSTLHPLLLASYRQLVAAAALTPMLIRALRHLSRADRPSAASLLRRSFLPGLALAAHFVTWIAGSRMTLAANAALIVNLSPVVMPFFLYVSLKESVTGREWAGTGIALAGVAVLAASDLRLGAGTWRGDALCLLSMLFFALYLTLARRRSGGGSLWLYVVPLYAIGGLACLIPALFVASPVRAYPLREVLLILGIGLVPTVIGHSLLNYCMQRMRGQVVPVVNMSEFVFAGVLAFFILGETPAALFYPSAALVVTGALTVLLEKNRASAA